MITPALRRAVSHVAWALGFLALARTGEVGTPLVLLWIAAWTAGLLFRDRGPLPAAGPVTTSLGLFVTAYAIGYRFLLRADLIGGILTFLVAIQALKLAAAKGKRDYLQAYLLCFFQLVTAGALLTTAVTLPLFFALLIAIVWGLYLLTASPPERHAERLPVTAVMAVAITAITPPVMAFSLLLFLLLPRARFGILTWSGIAEDEAIIGFSDTVAIGSFGTLRDDLTRVLALTVRQLPLVPGIPLRIRGLAFETFDGTSWSKPSLGDAPVPSVGSTFRLGSGSGHDGEIFMEPLDYPVLMVPEGTGTVTIRSRVLFTDRARNVFLPRIQSKPYQYRVSFSYPPPPETAGPGGAEAATALPSRYDRLLPLVREAVGSATSPREKASRIEAHLRTRYDYTRELPPVDGDPVEAFLLTTRRGHCEYFATAMAVMGRLAGVPTRVVNGFVVSEYNSVGGFYTVRQRDAHTWVQCLLPEGWVDFDPTPPSGDPSFGAPAPSLLRRWSESLAFTWRRYMYGYRAEDQRRVYGSVSSWYSRARGSFATPGRGRVAPGIIILAASSVIVLALFAAGRLRASSPGRRRPATASWRAYRRAALLFGRRGYALPDTLGATEFLSLLRSAGFPPPVLSPMERLTEAYLRTRFGPAPHPAREKAGNGADLAALRKALASAPPPPRR